MCCTPHIVVSGRKVFCDECWEIDCDKLASQWCVLRFIRYLLTLKKNLKSIHPLGNPLAFSFIFQTFFVHKRRKSYTVGPLYVKRNKLPRLVAGQKQPPFCFVKHLNNFYKCQNCGKCVKVWGVSFETFTKLFLDFWLIGGWFCPVTNLVAHVFWGATPPLWYQKESFL